MPCTIFGKRCKGWAFENKKLYKSWEQLAIISHAPAVLKSLIYPREATEARSLRSYPRFQGHCGILATGFPEGGNGDHTAYPTAWGFWELLQATQSALKAQLYFGYAEGTPTASEVWGEAGDCPKALEDKIHVWLLIKCPSCFITQGWPNQRPLFHVWPLHGPSQKQQQKCWPYPGILDSGRPLGNDHLQTSLVLLTEAKPHTGSESVPGPRDSCDHHRQEWSRAWVRRPGSSVQD